MKVPQKHEVKEYTAAIGYGAMNGALLGTGLSAGLYLYLSRRTNVFRQSGTFHKTLFLMSPIAICAMTNLELASRRFEEDQRERAVSGTPSTSSVARMAPTESMSLGQFALDHKYKIIVAGWAASMAGAWHFVNKDKYMTKSQKIVQARVYAQGITVLMLLASVVLSVSGSEEQQQQQKVEAASTSWKQDLKYVQDEARYRRPQAHSEKN